MKLTSALDLNSGFLKISSLHRDFRENIHLQNFRAILFFFEKHVHAVLFATFNIYR